MRLSNFLCDWFGWFCNDHVHDAIRNAPEIDGVGLTLAIALVVGLLCIAADARRKRDA